jgi:hypothetical protein
VGEAQNDFEVKKMNEKDQKELAEAIMVVDEEIKDKVKEAILTGYMSAAIDAGVEFGKEMYRKTRKRDGSE